MTDDEAPELDLACPVCGHTAALTDVTPIRFEHAVAAWRSVHTHTADEVDAWRLALSADAAAARAYYHEHGYDDGDES